MKRILVIIGIMSAMLLSFSACGGKREISNKIAITNEEEVKETQESTRIDYSTIEDFSVLEKTWKKSIHGYPEPPEDLKVYKGRENVERLRNDPNRKSSDETLDRLEQIWTIPYKCNGVEVWVQGSNYQGQGQRVIYKKTSDNPSDIDSKDDCLMRIKSGNNEPIYALIGFLGLGDAITKDVIGDAKVVNQTGGVNNNN